MDEPLGGIEQTGVDAITVLMNDHTSIDQLFEAFEAMPAQGAAEQKRELVERMIKELSVHASVEEQIFYPAIREAIPQGDDMVGESLDEHQEVKNILADLDKMSPDEEGFDQKVLVLIENVRHHVQEEEGDILPKLQAAVGNERLVEIGQRMEGAKKMAPTRPHPHAPNSPPGNIIAGPAAAAVDRLRDRGRDSLQNEE